MEMPQISAKPYTYSDEIPIKHWNGGRMWLQVGYLKVHPEHNQIVLFKSYTQKGGVKKVDKYYISGQDDWHTINKAVEKLWPELNSEGITPALIKQAVRQVSKERQLLDLIAAYPELLQSIPENIDIFSLPAEQKEALQQLLATGGIVAQRVIDKLSQQPINDLEDFDKILEELRLSTVNGLVNHVNSRLGFIKAFEIAIDNNDSYERRGPNSIHNLLKSNIWILNRNYTVLHDDETLKNIIIQSTGQQPNSDDQTSTRPDFLCMSSRREEGVPIGQIIIIEIKRPSVVLTMDHMNQLMGYKAVLEKHSGVSINQYRCILIGRQLNQILTSTNLTSSGYYVKTYTDFIGEARQFYEDYLEIVSTDNLAI